jgi:hypothetical protein
MILTLTQDAILCLQWYLPSFVSALVTCMAVVMSKFVSIEFNTILRLDCIQHIFMKAILVLQIEILNIKAS